MVKKNYPDPDSMSNLVVATTEPITSNFPTAVIDPILEDELKAGSQFRRRRPDFKG